MTDSPGDHTVDFASLDEDLKGLEVIDKGVVVVKNGQVLQLDVRLAEDVSHEQPGLDLHRL